MTFAADFLKETGKILAALDTAAIEAVAQGLAAVREGGGRIFHTRRRRFCRPRGPRG